MGVYQPMYLFIYLLVIGLLYVPVWIYAVSRFKLNIIGWSLAILSIGSYLIVGIYMVGGGYYADGGYAEDGYSSFLFHYGLPELILLSYPYIFVGLAILLGKK